MSATDNLEVPEIKEEQVSDCEVKIGTGMVIRDVSESAMGTGLVFRDPDRIRRTKRNKDGGFDSIPSKPKRGKPRQETQEVPDNTITPETPLLNNEELEMVETIESLFSKYQKSCKELTDFSNIHFSMGRPYNFMKSIVILRKILLSLSYRINMVNGCVKFSEEDLVKNAKFKTLINKTVLRKKTMINTSKSIRVRNEAANGVKTVAETYRERRAVRAAIQLLAEIMECYERCKECYEGCKRHFEESGMEAGEVVMRVEGEMEKIGEEVMMVNFVLLGQCVPQ